MSADIDGLLGAAVAVGVALPLTVGFMNMTERNVHQLIKQGKRQSRNPYQMPKMRHSPYRMQYNPYGRQSKKKQKPQQQSWGYPEYRMPKYRFPKF